MTEETPIVATASLNALRQYLPRGTTLDDDAFFSRHGWLCWLLGIHIPVLLAFGMLQGFSFEHSLTAVWVPMACLLVSLHVRQRRVVSTAMTVGLLACSTILVHLSGGASEAYLHVLVLLPFIALYQDWVPVFLAVGYGLVSVIAFPDGLFVDTDHGRPWTWVLVQAAALLAAGFAQLLFWRATDQEHGKSLRLARDLARAQMQIEARESVSELFVNLARRNQALLDRQINLLVAMEERQADPDELAELFQLDHLATRIRRNAESLLVLSGEEPARRWGRPVPMAEVVRAAIAEVEDFRRADMDVDEGVAVAGRAVADLAHLVAELVENGLQFSPPESRVRVSSRLRPDGACVIVVEDHGIGMSDADLATANDLLAHPPEVDLRLSKRLGFHVVARLAARYRMSVRLSATPGGGVTVGVSLPDDLVAREEPPSNGAEPHEAPDEPVAEAPAPPVVPPRGARPAMPAIPTIAGRPLVDPATLPVARRTAEAVAAEPASSPTPHAPVVPIAPARAPEPVRTAPEPVRAAPPLPVTPPEPVRAEPPPPTQPVLPPEPVYVREPVKPAPPAAPVPPAQPVMPAPSSPLEPVFAAEGAAVGAANGNGDEHSLFGGPALPRRVPQASLDPRMRTGNGSTPATPVVRNGVGGRSPEELRAQLSQFQAAQARGRNETSMPGDTGREEDR